MSTPAKLCLIALLSMLLHLGYLFAIGSSQNPGAEVFYLPYGVLTREELSRVAFIEVLVGTILLISFAILLLRESDQ